MLRENTQRFELVGGPDDEPFVGSTGSDIFASIRSCNAQYGCCMVLVLRIPGFPPVPPCARELDWSTADRAWAFGVGLLVWAGRRGRGGELPFDDGKVFVDGICEGGTGSYGRCAQALCAK